MTKKDVLVYLSIISNGDFDKIMEHIRAFDSVDLDEVERTVEKLDCETVTIIDPNYPEQLKHMYAPPVVLYYYGNLQLAAQIKKIYAYVGSRDASSYGEKMAEKIAGGCAEKGLILVNGMARGIDGIALRSALKSNGKCIVVLGSGINKPYPASNVELYEELKLNGLVLSEYPPNVGPDKEHFPTRNRIVVGLSKGVVIGESALKSGTMITARLASESGREVGAVPYHADEGSACNILIQEGAQMIETAQDVIEMLGISALPEKNQKNF